jgi:hypothetical protein
LMASMVFVKPFPELEGEVFVMLVLGPFMPFRVTSLW